MWGGSSRSLRHTGGQFLLCNPGVDVIGAVPDERAELDELRPSFLAPPLAQRQDADRAGSRYFVFIEESLRCIQAHLDACRGVFPASSTSSLPEYVFFGYEATRK